MGRMLEAFQLGRSRRGDTNPAAPALHAVWPDEELEEAPEGEEDIPFIEVGGDRTPITASSPDFPKALALPASNAEPAESAPRWMTVRFRAVPAIPLPHKARFAPELIAFHQPDHAISAQYRELATRLLGPSPADQGHTLLFTASGKAVGTTTVLLNAAVTLAKDQKRRVVLVDAHFRQPALEQRLGLPEGPGLRDVLAGRTPLEEAVRPTGLPGLSVLTAGKQEDVSPARLAGETMRAVLRQLRDQHEIVLIDGICWDGRPEVVALGCACDAVYLCLPETQENEAATGELLQIISEQGAALRGCILTSR